jgi:hypothetical protein
LPGASRFLLPLPPIVGPLLLPFTFAGLPPGLDLTQKGVVIGGAELWVLENAKRIIQPLHQSRSVRRRISVRVVLRG